MRSTIRTFLIFAVVSLGAQAALAQVPHLFFGASAQWNAPTGDFGEAADDVEGTLHGNAAGVMGGEFDVGAVSDNGQLYVGYRIVDFDQKNSDGDVEWKNNSRWLAGFRWHLLGTLASPITPTLGGGLSVGKTKGIFKQQGPADDLIQELTSDNTWGWFIEGGGAARLPQLPLMLNAGIQYHRYTASFESEYVDVSFKISYLTYLLGAQIYL
jgi:hypothetical protein